MSGARTRLPLPTGWRRPGLRARVTFAFAAGALVISSTVALIGYELTARHLMQERERTAVRGAYFDAAVVRQSLGREPVDVLAVLRSLDSGQNRRPLLRRDGSWYARSADEGLSSAVPTALQRLVEDDQPAVQRITVGGQPALVVGVPLNRLGEDFYEVQSLTEIDGTLQTLAETLALVALGATAAAALLSRLISRAALRPLREVVAAADRVSAGDLTARISGPSDRDLETLKTAFNAMVTEMAGRLERDRRFAADVSHELRSPLQTLTAAVSVLDRAEGGLEPRTAQALAMVRDETERFTRLVQDLLVLSRADTAPQLQRTDVAALLSRACERAGVSADLIDCDPTLPEWSLDPIRIEQALVNLLDNARQHGGGAVHVTASTVGGRLVITVDDAGPGVPEGERAVIFERFARGRTAHSRGDHTGSGLGLALVAQHAAAHGGAVRCLRRPGGGGRFELELPAVAARSGL